MRAEAPTSTEQIDENIAYAIGMEAVFYGIGPVVMRINMERKPDVDKPCDSAEAPEWGTQGGSMDRKTSSSLSRTTTRSTRDSFDPGSRGAVGSR